MLIPYTTRIAHFASRSARSRTLCDGVGSRLLSQEHTPVKGQLPGGLGGIEPSASTFTESYARPTTPQTPFTIWGLSAPPLQDRRDTPAEVHEIPLRVRESYQLLAKAFRNRSRLLGTPVRASSFPSNSKEMYPR